MNYFHQRRGLTHQSFKFNASQKQYKLEYYQIWPEIFNLPLNAFKYVLKKIFQSVWFEVVSILHNGGCATTPCKGLKFFKY